MTLAEMLEKLEGSGIIAVLNEHDLVAFIEEACGDKPDDLIVAAAERLEFLKGFEGLEPGKPR